MIKELLPEHHERDPNRKLSVTVIGPSCSGKSTLLRVLREQAYSVHPEPDNAIFPLFLKDPKKYGFLNQLNLSAKLMELEVQSTTTPTLTNPHFRESGLLATAVYNRYLRDQGYMSQEQYDHMNWLYETYRKSFPQPNLVVYLSAPDEELKKRSIDRDGAVALDPNELQPYWDTLLNELEQKGVPVLRINTSGRAIHETAEMILKEVDILKKSSLNGYGMADRNGYGGQDAVAR